MCPGVFDQPVQEPSQESLLLLSLPELPGSPGMSPSGESGWEVTLVQPHGAAVLE